MSEPRSGQPVLAAPSEGGAIVGAFYLLAPPRPRSQGLPAPAGCPEALQELVDALFLDAPPLLDGLDPDAVGLLLVHPDSGLCEEAGLIDRGHIVACVKPLSDLVKGSALSPGPAPQPGRFFAFLVAHDLTARWWGPAVRPAADPRSLS